MLRVAPYQFDRVFTVEESAPSPVNEPANDTSVEAAALRAELAALRLQQEGLIAAARADGFEAGLAQAREEREVALLSAVDALHAGIETLDAHFVEIEQRITGEAAELALAAAEKLAARALANAPGAAIDEALGRVLGEVARGTELEVRVHPGMVADVEARLAARQTQDRRRLMVTIVGDATLAPGDGRIAWEQGNVTLDAAARRAEIDAELRGLIAS